MMEKNETRIARTDCEAGREVLAAEISRVQKPHTHEGANTYKNFWHDNLAGGADADIAVLMYHVTEDANEDDSEEELKEADKPREGLRDTTSNHFESVLIFEDSIGVCRLLVLTDNFLSARIGVVIPPPGPHLCKMS